MGKPIIKAAKDLDLGWLPRASLARFLQLILADDVVTVAYALLEPLDGLDGA